MTTYRVGAGGATVFNASGKAVARLRPGSLVVEDIVVMAATKPAPKAKRRRTPKPAGKEAN